jgi:hypothetical protein
MKRITEKEASKSRTRGALPGQLQTRRFLLLSVQIRVIRGFLIRGFLFALRPRLGFSPDYSSSRS